MGAPRKTRRAAAPRGAAAMMERARKRGAKLKARVVNGGAVMP